MNRPQHTPPDLSAQRKAARKTALMVAAVAVLVFVAYMFIVWQKSHG